MMVYFNGVINGTMHIHIRMLKLLILFKDIDRRFVLNQLDIMFCILTVALSGLTALIPHSWKVLKCVIVYFKYM